MRETKVERDKRRSVWGGKGKAGFFLSKKKTKKEKVN